jgi:hypothetical protein
VLIHKQIRPNYSKIDTADITPPAAGNNFSLTANPGHKMQIIWLAARFTTDANIANRRFFLTLDVSGTARRIASSQIYQAENATAHYFIQQYVQTQPGAFNFSNYICLPNPIIISSGTYLRSEILNMQAGDTFGYIVFGYEEWISG